MGVAMSFGVQNILADGQTHCRVTYSKTHQEDIDGHTAQPLNPPKRCDPSHSPVGKENLLPSVLVMALSLTAREVEDFSPVRMGGVPCGNLCEHTATPESDNVLCDGTRLQLEQRFS